MNTLTAFLSLLVLSAHGEIAHVPLEERAATADYIVVGKISGIKKRAAHVTTVIDGQEVTRYFNIGTLEITRMLKKPPRFKDKTVSVVFQSERLPGEYENFPDYGVYFKDGDEGIWLLRWSESLNGKLIAGYDLNPLIPSTSEKEVLSALKPKKEKK